MANPPSAAGAQGQEPNPAVYPTSDAIEYPPIEYDPTPPPGYSLPPIPPPVPPRYLPPAAGQSPPAAYPPPAPYSAPGAFPPLGTFPASGVFLPPGTFPPSGAFPPPGTFPPPRPYPPTAGYGTPPGYPAYGASYVNPAGTNGMAIGALACSLVGLSAWWAWACSLRSTSEPVTPPRLADRYLGAMTAGGTEPWTSDTDGASLVRPRTNTLAKVALLASVVSLCGIGSVVGIALGVIALNQISVSGDKGRGLSVAAIFVGALTLLVSMVLVVRGLSTW